MNKIINDWIRKLKNWALPIAAMVLPIVEFANGFLYEFAETLNIDKKYVNVVRIAVYILTIVIIKKEAPTQNPDKLIEIAEKKAEQQNG